MQKTKMKNAKKNAASHSLLGKKKGAILSFLHMMS